MLYRVIHDHSYMTFLHPLNSLCFLEIISQCFDGSGPRKLLNSKRKSGSSRCGNCGPWKKNEEDLKTSFLCSYHSLDIFGSLSRDLKSDPNTWFAANAYGDASLGCKSIRMLQRSSEEHVIVAKCNDREM